MQQNYEIYETWKKELIYTSDQLSMEYEAQNLDQMLFAKDF